MLLAPLLSFSVAAGGGHHLGQYCEGFASSIELLLLSPLAPVVDDLVPASAGGASSSGKWVDCTSSAAIDRVLPEHLKGVEFSRRDVLLGDVPVASDSVSGGGVRGYDQRRD